MRQVEEQSSPCWWTTGPGTEVQGLRSESKAKVKRKEARPTILLGNLLKGLDGAEECRCESSR